MEAILEQINSVGKTFIEFAVPMLIQSSVLIIILLGLDLILRKRIRAVFRYWIWMIVLVKLMLPPSLSLPTSPAYWLGDKIQGIVKQESSVQQESIAYSPAIPERTFLSNDVTPPVNTIESTSNIEQEAVVPEISLSWQGFVFLIWFVSLLIMIALLIQRAIFVKQLVARSQNANDEMNNILECACRQMGIRKKIALKLSDTVLSPSVCGLIRPTILIPKVLAEKINSNNIRSILLHELAHIKRYDLWVNLLQTVLQIIYIYNPLLWVANYIIRNIREQAVDEMVIVAMGKQAEEYPKTLLNISKFSFGSAAFSLRLIGVAESKKALINRIKHITGRPFPTSAKLGVLHTLIIIITASIFLPMARATERPPSTWDLIRQARTEQAEPAEQDENQQNERVLHFPEERSLGRLMIGDEESAPDQPYPFGEITWESFGSANGDVKIPQGKIVQLILHSWTWQNPQSLSALKQLQPDDLYSLAINFQENETGPSPDDRCMPHIAYLTGLKDLSLINTNISAEGLKYLKNLKSLKRLNTRMKLTNEGLAEIVSVSSLKALSIRDNSLINDDLAQLAKLPLLEELRLVGKGHVNDVGLVHLAKLPNLKYLTLEGLVFTDAGMAHLKNCSSLLDLNLMSQQQLTNTALVYISEITSLENLDLYWNENITDAGIAYLKKLPSLKILKISHSKVTDEGLVHLSKVKSLEYLELPGGLTDEGLKHIINLHNLRFLRVGGMLLTDQSLQSIGTLGNLEELRISGKGLTDEGMKHISKLPNLKHLSISGTEKLTDKSLEELAALESLISFDLAMNEGISISGLKFLNRLKNLKKLTIRSILRGNSVMDISGLTKLEHLAINLNFGRKTYDSFRDEDLACLANLTELKLLAIYGAGISDRGIKHLSGLTDLEYLSIACLGEERITDEALKYLSDMHKLNRLHIKDGHFTDKALDYLGALSSLTELELTSDFAFSLKAIRDFQQKNPKITRLELMP